MSELKLDGGIEIKQATKKTGRRIAGLIWGSAGTGKTSLACTAPGKKLLINFDPDGDTSVADRDDVSVADYVSASNNIVDRFKQSDPLGIGKVIEQFDTIIVDSLTNIGYKALMHGVAQSNGATVERPSPQAYQIRNGLVLQLVKNLLALTGKYNKHIFFIAHEDQPVTDKDGTVLHITLSLGGKLPEQAALDFSEVWCLQDMGAGRDRRIFIRPARSRKPMKTRMFQTSGEPEFQWAYNPDVVDEEQLDMTVAGWYKSWADNEFSKLPLPKLAKKK